MLIKDFCRNSRPDLLFIEPSGMVTTPELSAASGAARRDCTYEVGPIITLVDAGDFDFLWSERQGLLVAQVSGARLTAISRADLRDEAALRSIRGTLQPYCGDLIEVSSERGTGLDAVMDVIVRS